MIEDPQFEGWRQPSAGRANHAWNLSIDEFWVVTPVYTISFSFFTARTKLRQGKVFTPVCDSVHGGVLCPGGVSARETPPYGDVRVVRIPLECIIVLKF